MLKRKRWRVTGLGFFVLLLLGVSFAMACTTIPEEKIQKAEEELKQAVVEEKRYPLYDNGKNFLRVEGPKWETAMITLQKWIDEHPEKEMFAPSASDANTNHGDDGWLVYYRDKENCPLTITK